MYRAVALLSLREPDRAPSVLARAHEIWMRPTAPPNRSSTVLVDDEDVTSAIRRQEVSDAASRVAADPGVREVLVEKQRALLSEGDWVAEGRDIGTVVAPDAELKIFLTASAPERARRRAAELGADPDMVLAEQALRDERDSTRAHSPLQVAPGAVTLDTSELMVEDVVERIAALARAAAAAGPGWLA
jgi:cytidylate kinase